MMNFLQFSLVALSAKLLVNLFLQFEKVQHELKCKVKVVFPEKIKPMNENSLFFTSPEVFLSFSLLQDLRPWGLPPEDHYIVK